MPAPAVYVLAIVGTVGAVLAFKEFVYEPHIAPAIDRWKLGYQTARAARRRRRAMEVSQDGSELLMSETRKKSKGEPSDKYSDSDDSDDEAHGKTGTTTGTSHNFMRDGLLIRRSTLITKSQLDVELDNLVAHEVNQWRSEVPGQVLRQRKNVSDHTLDESIQTIPYTPLSPSRTAHIVFDASAPLPSPPSSHIRLPSPAQTASALPTTVTPPKLHFTSKSEMTPSPVNVLPELNPPERFAEPAASSYSPIASPVSPLAFSPPPETTPFQHMVTHSTLLGNTSQLSPTLNVPSTVSTQSLQQSYHQIIPSLSQSYPQDLDYEHDLELLSPPSSRADSPFSLAALSPDQRTSSRTLSGFSSAISSPSPLRMDLGNQSYDAISAIPQIQLITLNDNMSTTTSAQSTTYLSFGEDSSDDGMYSELTQPYANPDASIDTSDTFGRTSAHEAHPQLHYHQPAALHPSLIHGPYHNNASPPYTSRLAGLPAASMTATAPTLDRAGSDVTLHPEGHSLGLFPIPAREPRTPALASTPPPSSSSHTANASVAVGAGSRDPSYFRASASPSVSASLAVGSPAVSASSYLSAYQGEEGRGVDFGAGGAGGAAAGRQTPAMHSDSDLSDLDFMSDYQPSEPSEVGSEVSELGEVSDESWSVASGPGSRASGSDVGGADRAGQGGRFWRA